MRTIFVLLSFPFILIFPPFILQLVWTVPLYKNSSLSFLPILPFFIMFEYLIIKLITSLVEVQSLQQDVSQAPAWPFSKMPSFLRPPTLSKYPGTQFCNSVLGWVWAVGCKFPWLVYHHPLFCTIRESSCVYREAHIHAQSYHSWRSSKWSCQIQYSNATGHVYNISWALRDKTHGRLIQSVVSQLISLILDAQ